MVFGSNSTEEICSDIRLAIESEVSGAFSILSVVNEEFFPTTDAAELQLLELTSKAFNAVVHDLINIRTLLLRMETMISVPGLEPNRLHHSLSADVDHFFSYIQSIFDYLAEGLILVFPYKYKNRVNFAHLKRWYDHNEQINPSKRVNELRDILTSCDWVQALRDIRNGIIHSGYQSLVMIPLREDDILFQVFDSDSPMIIRALVNEQLFSNDYQTYLSFKKYAGIVLGRLITLLNRTSDVLLQELRSKFVSSSNLESYRVILPNMSIVIHWMELGLLSFSKEEESYEGGCIEADYRSSLCSFIDKLIFEAEGPLSEKNRLDSSIRIGGLIELLTNEETFARLPSLQDQSIYSFKVDCAKRKHERDSRRLLSELVGILKWLRRDLNAGKLKGLGRIDASWTLDDIEMMISPFPSR